MKNMYERCLYHCEDCNEEICQGIGFTPEEPCPMFITEEMLDNKEEK